MGFPSLFTFYWLPASKKRWFSTVLIELCFVFFAITAHFAVGLVAPAIAQQMKNRKPKVNLRLSFFCSAFLTATVLSRLIVFASKIVWLNLPWQLIGGAEGPRDSSYSRASSVGYTSPSFLHHFSRQPSESRNTLCFKFVRFCMRKLVHSKWFDYDPNASGWGRKAEKNRKKTEKQKHECIKLWKCFKCFSFLSFSRALQSVSWPRAVKNRLDLLTRVANIQLSSTAVAYWLHIKKHLNRREGS